MKTKRFSPHTFSISFSSTLLIFILFAVLFYIAYRMESVLNLEPVAIFTLTNHQNGDFSYSFFNIQGSFSLKWLYDLTVIINQFQVFIPVKIKLSLQAINALINEGSQLLPAISM